MSASKSSLAALTLGAIGVVYGDIGTSVLYAMKEVFGSGHVPFTRDNVFGILSIFFWTLTVIVSIKYVVLVLRADNHGEGGLVAMLALASQSVKDRPELRRVLLLVGIFGTCLFYGDGVITPAISVLGAVEGLEVISPTFKKFVIPLTLVILLALFMVQKHGTASMGRFFGPIMVVWFAVIAGLGRWLSHTLGEWVWVAQTLNSGIGFAITAAIFALIYKLMPRAQVQWNDVWVGAVVTALLFSLGKALISLYLSASGVASAYGAAGSLVLVLLWVYYSAQVFLLGAEFTWVYANARGSRRAVSR